MKISRIHVTVFLALAVVVWTVVLYLRKEPLSWGLFAPFGLTVSILAGIGWLYEKWMWSFPVISLLSQRPDVRGTWLVELKSNPETQEGVPPIRCLAAVTQSFSKFQLKFMTKESQSWFVSSEFSASNKSDGFELYGVYTNQPKIELRDTRSPIHNGALRLELHGPKLKPDFLEGEYWTDRSTGALYISSHEKTTYTPHTKAQNEPFQLFKLN